MEIFKTMDKRKFSINNRRYLGSKFKLIDFIHRVVDEHCSDINSVMDLFAGTGVVGYSFNQSCSVILNDILSSNEVVYQAFFGKQTISEFKLSQLIDHYNSVTPEEDNYYSENFSDTYLSRENMKKLGFIRDDIDRLFIEDKINHREKDILICSLLYAIDRIANTVGHYDAYRRDGDRSADLVMLMPDLPDNKYNENNQIFRADSNEIVKNVYADLVYIDPPYNSRQYCDAYHFLENVAQNNKPEVFGVARKMNRSELKSQYCTSKAPAAFADLIENISAKYILVSYSDTGTKGNDRSNAKISDQQILDILARKGSVQVFEQDYNIFTTGKTQFGGHKERLFLCTIGPKTAAKTQPVKNEGYIKSPLNYTGGKHKILAQLTEKFPKDSDVFYDIFCGGANVGINMNGKIVCIDNNEKLIHLLNYMKKMDYYDLVERLDKLIKEFGLSNTYKNGYEYYGCSSDSGIGQYNKEKYLRLKEAYNKAEDEQSDLFLLLIIYGFNNQIRFNSKNEFNLPVGKRDFNASLRSKLESFMTAAQSKDISFVCSDFRDIDLTKAKNQNTFFYLDPPYLLGTASYNENNGWSNSDERDLLNFLKQCNDSGIRFALSNVIEHKGRTNDELIQWTLDNQFNINYISRSYNNANYHLIDKSAVSKEVLITNY